MAMDAFSLLGAGIAAVALVLAACTVYEQVRIALTGGADEADPYWLPRSRGNLAEMEAAQTPSAHSEMFNWLMAIPQGVYVGGWNFYASYDVFEKGGVADGVWLFKPTERIVVIAQREESAVRVADLFRELAITERAAFCRIMNPDLYAMLVDFLKLINATQTNEE